MVQKRQLADEEYDVSPKHLKLENGCQLIPCLEFPSTDVPLKPCSSGIIEPCISKEPFETYCQFENGTMTEKPIVIQENPPKPRTLIQPENSFSRLLYFSPLKQTPVGPEYQADIPEWCGYDKTNGKNKFLGSCIIPLPESNSSICNDDDLVGKGRTDCLCEDRGSYRCVRKHIIKARDSLRVNIGQERFSALGFNTMGDVVSSKWTEEDEQLFHEVVYSNPATLGKNFWEILTETFPSQTNQEIVSYYFNVFVLQKRAEQNRCDPMNVDSDDDEWQGDDDASEEDEDLCRDEIEKYSFSIKDAIFDYKACDFQDDSCTSFEFDEPQKGDVIFDHLDSKAWDVGCFSFPINKAEFLPTGSMIEEVFGDRNLEFQANRQPKKLELVQIDLRVIDSLSLTTM